MDKNTARQLIKKTFQNPFDKDSFVYFVKNLLNYIEEAPFIYRGNFIPDAFDSYVKTLERIGKYQDPEDKEMDILIVRLKKESSLEHARTMQRNFVAWYLNGSRGGKLKDAALVAFVAPNGKDWRFSLVKMEYKLAKTQTGRVRAKEELTPARRYSFLVGIHESSHTAQSRLVPILEDDVNNPTLKQLEESFNIEKVTKEFFEKYRELYHWIKEELDAIVSKNPAIKKDFNEKSISAVDFAKKLLGQIIFLYFLQKKGWFGVRRGEDWGMGSKRFLRELFEKKHGDYKNFFNEILEPLFYEALRLERPGDYYSRFDCRIPFLNGGLFDPINDYDWWNTDILLPNDLFSNDNPTKEGDKGDGILDVFDRYNFTVKEDEPLEKEVAVDPEMLGKVFENLLEVKDRKSKGTYYTPREIVHYMCRESLINYLEAETSIDKEKLNLLVHFDQFMAQKMPKTKRLKAVAMWEGEVKEIEESLEKIRIVDPACGSGAFLVGMMQEIIGLKKILSLFFKTNNLSNYQLKLQSIQNNLYGVDIDPSAVEIAKLRLWLSLVVDEEDIKQIKPLPNLDYKIMQGNSLIELLSGEFLVTSTDQRRTELVNELKKTKDKLFDIASPSQKEQKRQEIDELIKEIFEYDKDLIINNLRQRIQGIQNQGRLFKDAKLEVEDKKKIDELENKIKEIQKMKIPGPTEHFEWHINFSEVFQEKGGFEVVIANPPYVTTKYGKISESLKKVYVKNFESAYDKLDLYVLFIEKAIKISKRHGFTTLITPWNFLANFYSFKIRKFLLDNTKIKLFNKLPPKVFGSIIVDNIISIFEKDKNNQGNSILFDDLFDKSNQKYINQDIYLQNEKYVFTFPNDSIANEILNKMKINSVGLGKIALNYIGIMTGGQKEMIANSPVFKNSKPVLSGKDIARWMYFDRGNFVNFDKSKIHSNDNEEVYLSEKKILLRKTGRKLVACMDKSQFFTIQSLYNIVVKNKEYIEEYLLSLLNSKLFTYIYNKFFITNPEVFPYIKRKHLDQLPIKVMSLSQQRPFIDLVNKILAITKNKNYLENSAKQAKVHDYEKQIDRMVYKLYGLTKEEIKIIENFNSK